MPTFIGAQGGGSNPIADAMKNFMQTNSPVNLAHAALYGASARKTQSEADKAALLFDGLQQLRKNGVIDTNDPSQMGAAVINGLTKNLSQGTLAYNAARYGATDPRTVGAFVGNEGDYRATSAGQGVDLAASAARQNSINRTSERNTDAQGVVSRANNADTNATSITTTGMQGDVSRQNNRDTNATSITTTGMQGDVSRANNADTNRQSGLNNTATNQQSAANTASTNGTRLIIGREGIAAENDRRQREADDKLVDGFVNGNPASVRAGDVRKGLVKGWVPKVSLDEVLGNAAAPPAQANTPNSQVGPTAQPQGVLAGGAVPGQIPPAPSFLPPMPPPVSAAQPQTIQVPLAHDLTNTVEVPPPSPPGVPQVVNPPLTVPPSMGGAPQGPMSRINSVIESLPMSVRNAKGLLPPQQQTFIDVAGQRVGTSPDRGQTIMVNGKVVPNDGTFLPAGQETGIGEARTTLEKAGIKPFEPADPRVGQLFQSAIKPGVGGIAGFLQRDINTALGSTGLAAFLPGGQFGADQNAARQRLDIFNEQMKKALLGGRASEAGVKEQGRISGLLPSDGIFTNPATEANKIVQLYGALMEQNRALVSRLQRVGTTGPTFEKMRAMLDENENALKMVTDPAWATKYTGETTVTGAPGGDQVDMAQRPGGPAPPAANGGFKVLGVRDK